MSQKEQKATKKDEIVCGEAADLEHQGVDESLHRAVAQEHEESEQSINLTDIFFISAFFMMLSLGFGFLFLNSGGWDSMNYVPAKPDASGEQVAVVAPELTGAELYGKYCASCHQADGKGLAGAFPPLLGSKWVLGSKERTSAILLSGLNGPIEVLGTTYNGNMPAFAASLKDDELAKVVNYIRQELGDNAAEEAVTVEEMAGYRESARASAWTAEELLEAHPDN